MTIICIFIIIGKADCSYESIKLIIDTVYIQKNTSNENIENIIKLDNNLKNENFKFVCKKESYIYTMEADILVKSFLSKGNRNEKKGMKQTSLDGRLKMSSEIQEIKWDE